MMMNVRTYDDECMMMNVRTYDDERTFVSADENNILIQAAKH